MLGHFPPRPSGLVPGGYVGPLSPVFVFFLVSLCVRMSFSHILQVSQKLLFELYFSYGRLEQKETITAHRNAFWVVEYHSISSIVIHITLCYSFYRRLDNGVCGIGKEVDISGF